MHSRLMQRALMVAGVAALATLTACAQPFQARVESFQAMPPAQGQSFTMKPADASLNGSLEFATYANLVATELQKHGFRPATAGGDADLVVTIDYGSGPPRERLASRPSAFAGSMGMGFGRRGWGGWGWGGYPGFYSPFYSPWGWNGYWNQQELYSYTIYPAYLHVMIQRASDHQGIFEGRAETTTRANDLPITMPKLVTALFTDFPGNSAVSKIVKVPAAK